MNTLQESAQELDRALTKAASAIQDYFYTAQATARDSGRDSTEGGMSARQLKIAIQNYVIAKLSPRPVHGQPDPVLTLPGAPEARRHAVRGLPGLT
jgi:hypothetical protein